MNEILLSLLVPAYYGGKFVGYKLVEKTFGNQVEKIIGDHPVLRKEKYKQIVFNPPLLDIIYYFKS